MPEPRVLPKVLPETKMQPQNSNNAFEPYGNYGGNPYGNQQWYGGQGQYGYDGQSQYGYDGQSQYGYAPSQNTYGEEDIFYDDQEIYDAGYGQGDGAEMSNDLGSGLKEIPHAWLNRLLPSTEPMQGMDWQSVFGRVFFLDDHGVFRPLDLERVLAGEMSHYNDLTGLPYNVGEILQQFTTLPLGRIHHYANMGEYLRALFDEKKLVDVLIHIKDKMFAAHRIALACHSVYFARAFILNQHQKHKLTEIKLRSIQPHDFYAVLRFIYTGRLHVNDNNVDGLMHVANQLQIPAVLFKCLDFLGHMPVAPAVDLVTEPDPGVIRDQAGKLLEGKLRDVMQSDFFLTMGIEPVEMALGDDALVVDSELDVFYAALSWLAYEVGPRRKYLDRLMRQVRFTSMAPVEVIEATQANNLIRNSPYCRNRVMEAIWLMTIKKYRTYDVLKCHCPKPRSCLRGLGPEYDGEDMAYDSGYLFGEEDGVDGFGQPGNPYSGSEYQPHIVRPGMASPDQSRAPASQMSQKRMNQLSQDMAQNASKRDTRRWSVIPQGRPSLEKEPRGASSRGKLAASPSQRSVGSRASQSRRNNGQVKLTAKVLDKHDQATSILGNPSYTPQRIPSGASVRRNGKSQPIPNILIQSPSRQYAASVMSGTPSRSQPLAQRSPSRSPPLAQRSPSRSPSQAKGSHSIQGAPSGSPSRVHKSPSRTPPFGKGSPSRSPSVRSLGMASTGGPRRVGQSPSIESRRSRGRSKPHSRSPPVAPRPIPLPPAKSPARSMPEDPPPSEEDVPFFKFYSSQFDGENVEGRVTGVEVGFQRKSIGPSGRRRVRQGSDAGSGAGGQASGYDPLSAGDILAVGGYMDSDSMRGSSNAQRLGSDQKSWEKFSEMPEARLNFAAAYLNGHIYVVGGYDPCHIKCRKRATKSTFQFDPVKQTWLKVCSMLCARSFHTVCVLDGRIYAMGGQDENEEMLDSVEVYDSNLDNWLAVASMAFCRVGASSAGFEDCVMIVGGYGESNDDPDDPCPVLMSSGRLEATSAFRVPRRVWLWWTTVFICVGEPPGTRVRVAYAVSMTWTCMTAARMSGHT
ncbi:uncharacterized protein [Littorina saxatilis]|uniref:uncharacterized protein isoform X2 n=1 Tax=Littorina saxatilis TaxID=31220 RepID=UPI0038B51412